MSYEEFGKLKFLDFFPRTEAYKEDHEGGLESGIGLACTEGYLDTAFTSPVDVEWQTAEMLLEFWNDCPERQGNALLDYPGLGLRKGMSCAQVKEALGKGNHAQVEESLGNAEKDIPAWLVFIVGKEWPYYVGSLIKEQEGLIKVWMCRKDLSDEVPV